MYDDYLKHYGIKGMRWGVRRYRNEDGSLTPAGKKKYGSDFEKASKEFASAKATYSRYRSRNNRSKLALAKTNYKDAKIRSKIKQKGPKSERFKSLEKKYKEKYDLTDSEAEIAAYKRQRTEKIIAASAAVAATAAVAYVGYKNWGRSINSVVDTNTKVSDIERAFRNADDLEKRIRKDLDAEKRKRRNSVRRDIEQAFRDADNLEKRIRKDL